MKPSDEMGTQATGPPKPLTDFTVDVPAPHIAHAPPEPPKGTAKRTNESRWVRGVRFASVMAGLIVGAAGGFFSANAVFPDVHSFATIGLFAGGFALAALAGVISVMATGGRL